MPKSSEHNFNSKVLDSLFKEFKGAGVDLDRMNDADLDLIKHICNQKDAILWIHNYAKIEPYFINNAGKEYFGFDYNDLSSKGFDFFINFVHRDDVPTIHNTVNYYLTQPKGTNRLAYRSTRYDGQIRWLFSIDKVLNFNQLDQPQYLLAMSIDIEDMFNQLMPGRSNAKNIKQKWELYNKLTRREREIIALIAQEMTSQEIGDKLFIESSTVDTHRKNIIKKLNVRGSLGLVQYALLFS